MYPILFSLGRLHVYTHGLLMAIGGIVGGLTIYYLARQKKLPTDFVLDLCVYSLFAGIIGARILFVILYFDQFQSFREMLYIWYGGLVSYGGLIGGLLIAWLYLRAKKQPVLKWFDLGVIGLLVGWVFGRVGCLLNGDSVGIISQSKIAIWGRIPTQVFESIWAIIAAKLCYFGLNKQTTQVKKHLPDGIIFILGLGLYAIGRFVIDFYRDEPITLWILKDGQIASLLVLILAILAGWFLIKNKSLDKTRDRGDENGA